MTLKELFESYGRSAGEVAALVNVDPRLFTSIDNRRQPLPLPLAADIAATLGVQRWEVVTAASSTIQFDGTRYRMPLPPRELQYLWELEPPPPPVEVAAALSTVTLGAASLSFFK